VGFLSVVDQSVVTLDGLQGGVVAKGDVILREVEVAIVEAGSIESLVLSAGEFASVSPIRIYYYFYYYYYTCMKFR